MFNNKDQRFTNFIVKSYSVFAKLTESFNKKELNII